MKIVVAHNGYQQGGGEDSVVEAEVALLRHRSDEVVEYRRHNDELATTDVLSAAGGTLWSKKTVKEIDSLLDRVRPDVIHVHNTFPLISPSLYWAAARANIPVVQTLHNFRLLCPQAMFLRDDRVCEDCLGKIPWRGIAHACYRGSVAQSAVLASMLVLHRSIGTWRNKVTRYIALNEFCRRKFIEGGLPAQRVVVKPNFVDLAPPAAQVRRGFLFVGRLSREKGIGVLVRAMQSMTDANLAIAGTGPEAHLLEDQPYIHRLGPLDPSAVYVRMQQAQALVLPSIWYENFPRTLVEAFASGLPVIASRIGALAELVEDGVTGLLFDAGNSEDLGRRMRWALDNPERMLEMGKSARKLYEERFSAEVNYRSLIGIYQESIDELAR